MDNLLQLQVQIEQLQKQAADLKTRDFDKTVREIQETMRVFGITVKDLQVIKRGRRSGPGNKPLPASKKVAGSRIKKTTGQTVAPKYRGPNGETWSGRGLSPRWLATLVEQGAKREDFAITS